MKVTSVFIKYLNYVFKIKSTNKFTPKIALIVITLCHLHDLIRTIKSLSIQYIVKNPLQLCNVYLNRIPNYDMLRSVFYSNQQTKTFCYVSINLRSHINNSSSCLTGISKHSKTMYDLLSLFIYYLSHCQDTQSAGNKKKF